MCREMELIYCEGIEKGEMRGFERGEKRGFEKGEKHGFEKGEKHGFEKGELRKAKETALSLAEMGLSAEQIAQAVKISVDTVQHWIKESTTTVPAGHRE